MNEKTTLPEDARREVRRIVLISRLAGGVVVLALAVMAVYVHWRDMYTVKAVAQLATVAVGAIAFFCLSTLARLGHTRVIERTLGEVHRLSNELRAIADTDPLTGLSNLRAFQARLATGLDGARQAGTSVSLIVADLDNFKLLNDAYGHQFGDRVLQGAANVFAGAAGTTACAARLGGDEFAIILPGHSNEDALAVAEVIQRELSTLRLDERAPAALGSFGVATFPQDGEAVQALFACADSRMYSEKHRRKTASASSLAGAARNLFVRAGQSMRPDHTTAQILQEIAGAARDELGLTLCGIAIPAREHHGALAAVSASDASVEAGFTALVADSAASSSAVAALLPAEAWVVDAAVPDGDEERGNIVLAGMPSASFRPDALIVLALADLVQAVVTNGRAHADARRAGRERDIHVDLARTLASSGSLEERVTTVTAMIADLVGVTSVSIEGLATATGDAAPINVASGLSGEWLTKWRAARAEPDAQEFVRAIAADGPVTLMDPATEPRVPADERELLRLGGVTAAAICPIRFDGELLGILGAASNDRTFFPEEIVSVLMSIADHLAPAIKVALLRDELEASYVRLEQASRDSLVRLADAAEARDPHTGGHLRRIRTYSVALARELGLPDDQAEAIGVASTIHDLGKLRLPDAVLLKRGKLDLDDWARMREHPQDGERLIGDSPMFEIERTVARWHHERWDGSGYPDGLRGEEIPLSARIVAVADAFDALTTERPYKSAWTPAAAVGEIVRMRATLFCPAVVGALEALWDTGRLQALYEATGGGHVEHAALHRQAA